MSFGFFFLKITKLSASSSFETEEKSGFVLSLEKLVKKLPKRVLFSGPGVPVFKDMLEKIEKTRKFHYLLGENSLPSGVAVAKLGLEKLRRKKIEDLNLLIPLYVRESEAELKFKNE